MGTIKSFSVNNYINNGDFGKTVHAEFISKVFGINRIVNLWCILVTCFYIWFAEIIYITIICPNSNCESWSEYCCKKHFSNKIMADCYRSI